MPTKKNKGTATKKKRTGTKKKRTATKKKRAAKKPAAKRAGTGDVVVVENVNHPGQKRRVDGARYRAVEVAMMRVLPKTGGLTQSEMIAAVRNELTGDLRAKAGWWTKCVHLDLEAKGVVVRDGGKPLRWRLTG